MSTCAVREVVLIGLGWVSGGVVFPEADGGEGWTGGDALSGHDAPPGCHGEVGRQWWCACFGGDCPPGRHGEVGGARGGARVSVQFARRGHLVGGGGQGWGVVSGRASLRGRQWVVGGCCDVPLLVANACRG